MAELTPQTSPVLRAIRHLTCHPAEGPPPADTTHLAHALNLITGKVQPDLIPRGIASPLKSRKTPASLHAPTQQHIGMVATVALGALLILAASKHEAFFESLRDAIQHRWAALERKVLQGKDSAVIATRTVSTALKAHTPAAMRGLRRIGPALLGLVAVSLLSRAYHNGELQKLSAEVRPRLAQPQRHLREQLEGLQARPGFVRKSAALIATLTACGMAQCLTAHKPAIGTQDPYKRTRLRVQHGSHVAQSLCASCPLLMSMLLQACIFKLNRHIIAAWLFFSMQNVSVTHVASQLSTVCRMVDSLGQVYNKRYNNCSGACYVLEVQLVEIPIAIDFRSTDLQHPH
jgi:hypothetical protein